MSSDAACAKRKAEDGQAEEVDEETNYCANDECSNEVDVEAVPCVICDQLYCKECMMHCALCGYEMCRACIDCACYSDSNWIVEVVRKSDGKRMEVCIGMDGCLQKAEHKNAFFREGARGDESSEGEESSSEESDVDPKERRKQALRELADLA